MRYLVIHLHLYPFFSILLFVCIIAFLLDCFLFVCLFVCRSLGCTIIELLTGYPPYHELTQVAALYSYVATINIHLSGLMYHSHLIGLPIISPSFFPTSIVNDDHPPIPEGISQSLRDFLVRCFQKVRYHERLYLIFPSIILS